MTQNDKSLSVKTLTFDEVKALCEWFNKKKFPSENASIWTVLNFYSKNWDIPENVTIHSFENHIEIEEHFKQ